MLARVRKLLAKAEGTQNEHEASAFMAKAQELMEKFAIDEAQARATGVKPKLDPIKIELEIAAHTPGGNHKRILLQRIAKANRCRSWYVTGSKWNYVVGMPDDVRFVEMLFNSIDLQMGLGYVMAEFEKPPGMHGRTWKTDYIAGYVTAVTSRLRKAADESKVKITNDNPHALVLMRDVEKEVDRMLPPGLRSIGTPMRSGAGFNQGYSDGKRADVSGGRFSLGNRKQLPGSN